MSSSLEDYWMTVLNNSSMSYDYDDNDTCDLEEGMRFEAVYIPVLYILALVVGVLGNALLLGVLGRKRHQWSVADTFILHLGVSDILLLVTLPFWATQATQVGWVFGTTFCKIAGALFTVGSGLNTFRVVLLFYFVFLNFIQDWMIILTIRQS